MSPTGVLFENFSSANLADPIAYGIMKLHASDAEDGDLQVRQDLTGERLVDFNDTDVLQSQARKLEDLVSRIGGAQQQLLEGIARYVGPCLDD